jgi:hypothetical protein
MHVHQDAGATGGIGQQQGWGQDQQRFDQQGQQGWGQQQGWGGQQRQ